MAKFACERTFGETDIYPQISGVLKHHYVADLEALDLFTKLLPFRDQGIHATVERGQMKDSRTSGKHVIDYEL